MKILQKNRKTNSWGKTRFSNSAIIAIDQFLVNGDTNFRVVRVKILVYFNLENELGLFL